MEDYNREHATRMELENQIKEKNNNIQQYTAKIEAM